mgnify:CR=1 FL=1
MNQFLKVDLYEFLLVAFAMPIHTVQRSEKSQEKYSNKMVCIFEIHLMKASKRRITLNCNRTRSRDS